MQKYSLQYNVEIKSINFEKMNQFNKVIPILI